MTKLEEFIVKVRELAADAPKTIITMPPNYVGLPEGHFIPQSLFNYIADCLENKVVNNKKGDRRD